MRRIAISAAVIGGVVVAARVLAPKLHARMLATCKGMFEHMPEDFPPKRMMAASRRPARTRRGYSNSLTSARGSSATRRKSLRGLRRRKWRWCPPEKTPAGCLRWHGKEASK